VLVSCCPALSNVAVEVPVSPAVADYAGRASVCVPVAELAAPARLAYLQSSSPVKLGTRLGGRRLASDSWREILRFDASGREL